MSHGRRFTMFFFFVLCSLSAPLPARAQQAMDPRVPALETRLSRVESQVNRIDEKAGTGLILFLIGSVCALWAQNTRRNAWLWFFLGIFFSVFTLLAMLKFNSDDLDNATT